MRKFSFITFTDVHISATNPRSRQGDYKQDIIDKLDQIKAVGEKLKVAFFVFAGDLFNLKAPMRNPHSLNSTLIDLFKSFPAPVYATEGNHDLRYDSYETFEEQPLKVIYSSGALRQTRDIRIEPDGIDVHLRGFPFEENPNFKKMPKADKHNCDISICLLHLYTSPSGGSLPKQKIYGYHEISELGDDIYVMGHYHIDHGIIQVDGKTYVNVGAISRGSISEEDINRQPKIGWVTVTKDDNGIQVEGKAIKLKVRPVDEVFDLEQHEEDKKSSKEAEEFVSKLKTDMSDEISGEDRVGEEINRLDLEKDVLERLEGFLEDADIELKERV